MKIIIIVIICAAAAVACFFLLNHFGTISLFGKQIPQTPSVLPETVSGSKNGILYNDMGTLKLMDYKQKELWQTTLDSPDTTIVASDQLIAAYNGTSLNVMNFNKEQLFSATSESAILRVSVGTSHVAVLTSTVTDTGFEKYLINMYDDKGVQLGQIEFSMRQVVDFLFATEKDMFCVLSLDVSGVVPYSYITTYKFDGQMTGSIEINSQLVENIYVTSSSIFAAGTNNLSAYTYFGEKQGETLLYGWETAADSINAQNFVLACVPRTDTASIDSAKLFLADLSETIIHMPQGVKNIAVTQNKMYAFSGDTIYTYSLKGELEQTTETPDTIVRARQISDTCAILWSNTASYVYTLA